MIRMSVLRNRPVIMGNIQIGYAQSVIPDHAQKRVHALIVSRGIRGKCMVLHRHIQHISDQYILVSNISRYDKMKEAPFCRFALDTTGRLAGRVMDCAIDARNMDIVAVEIMPGYFPSENGIRLWVYAYQKNRNTEYALTIPVMNAYEPTLFEEGF